MSQINVNTIRNRTGGPPSLDQGAVVTGIITATTGEIAGDLTVGGTLTYEDVTNIDSVGLVTAKSGIKVGNPVSPGIGATIDPNGNAVFAGIVTASEFRGDGSQLTGIDATKIIKGNTEAEAVDNGGDGHIKMTTEGSERLRVGPAGEIGIAGANYGTSGQVLSSGGSGAAPSWAAASSVFAGGNSIQLVADGTIAAGKSVILTAAGKVAQVASPLQDLANIEAAANEKQYSTNTDGGIPAESNGNYQSWAYGPTRGAVAHVFKAGNSMGSNQYFAWNSNTVGLIDGGGYGMLPYDDHWNNHQAHAITWCKTVNTNNDLFVMTTLDQDNDNLYARPGIMASVGTVAWGEKFNIEAANDAETHRDSLCYDPNNDRVIVAYEEQGVGKVKVGTITSSDNFATQGNLTITWGSSVTFDSGSGCKYINCVYDDTADKVVIIWSDGDDADKGRSIVGTTSNSDNSITLGSEVSFHASDGAENTRAVYDPDAGRIVVHYRDDGDFDEPYIRSGVVSGTGASATITWTSATVIWGDTPSQLGLAYDTSSNKHVALFTRNNDNWIRTFTINSSTGAVENLASDVKIDSNNRGHGDIIALGVDGRILVRFSNGYIRAIWTQKPTPNVTTSIGAGSVLGFVDDVVSDGQTATVKLTGNVSTSQSGLTVGSRYYIWASGDLNTTWDSNNFASFANNTPYAGVAIAADKLLIGDIHKLISTVG